MFRVKTSSTSGQMLTISEYDWLNRSVYNTQGDHSPDNVKFPDNFMIFPCYSYHADISVIVSGGGRNATVHDAKTK